MADFDPKNNAENFDKEFSLNSNKKPSGKGKLPSWIMILLGAAMIGAVVAVKNPVVREISGTRASVSVQTAQQTAPGSTVSFTGDEKADPKELEAHFGTVNSGSPETVSASFVVSGKDQVFNLQMDELPVDENGQVTASEEGESDSTVYWVDEKPYAVTLEPAEETGEDAAADTVNSVYSIDGKLYDVHLEPVSSEEAEALSDDEQAVIVRAGDDTYRLRIDAVETADAPAVMADPELQTAADDPEQQAADEDVPESEEDPFADDTQTEQEPQTKAAEDPEPAIVWVNNRPYLVTVKPYDPSKETAAEETSKDGKAVIPVTVIEDESKPKPKTAVFEAEGEQYEITVTAIDPDNALSSGNAQPVVWIGETPLRVELQPDGESEDSFEILLEQLSEEDTAVLYESRYGKAYDSGSKSAEPEEVTEDTVSEPEPTPEATEEPEKENWFVGVFHKIFGGKPTEVPTPQVTVIAVTPTAVPARPTATPIVVKMAPTDTVQEPVRLDDEESDPDQKAGDLEDPALWDDSGDDDTGSVQPSENGTSQEQPIITVYPTSTKQSPVEIPVTVVTETPMPEGEQRQPTAVPTQEELPQTGMAESWNIPSMMAVLFGLLLVIIGVRRLRANR